MRRMHMHSHSHRHMHVLHCMITQGYLPPCHPAIRVSTHSRAVLPSHDTFFTVDASHEPGMACVEVTHTRAHARAPLTPHNPLLPA